ncbi:MAG: hypothetical protein QOJ75_595 [Chloroflexota bacterium]|nr:hypothetical protein [Chloroflexota bacterium]
MRTIRLLIPSMAIALIVAACAGSAAQRDVLSTVGSAVDGSAYSGAAGPVPAASAAPAAASSQGGGTPSDIGAIGAQIDAKIIRTGTIELNVSDVPKALRAARDGIVAMGGYVGASTTSNDGDQPSAEITYRIPADRWENALDLLRGLNGLTTKVIAEHTEAVEVTGQVIDLQARVKNLQASEVALQGIASRATKISDVLEVEAQLTDVRGQIEELTAQLKDLNDRAGYATLTARFSVPVVATTAAAKGWEPSAVVDEAAASMISILQSLANAGIWFLIVWLPIMIVLGGLAAVGLWIARRAGFGRRPGVVLPPPPPSAPMASES